MAKKASVGWEASLSKFMLKGVKPLKKELGRGSYGAVLEVELDGQICAGKVTHEILLSQDSEIIKSKFLRECQLMSEVKHDNITKFLGVCRLPSVSPLPVLVMEKLNTNLDEFIEKSPKPINITTKISILVGIAGGLDYLHSRDPPIIHRDLTAKNVLLTADLKAKITDFGNSRFADLQPGKLPTEFPGTFVYMPPEASSFYGPELDIFSFGHLALFLLIEVFPGNLLPSTFKSEQRKLVARSEVERRGMYFEQLKGILSGTDSHPLVVLTKKCLDNYPSERCTTKELVSTLKRMNIVEDVQLLEAVEEWKEKGRREDPIVLVVTGKPGVGKSTLVNNFLGLKTGKRAKTARQGRSVTTRVTEYVEEVNGITVKVIDTPGLEASDLTESQVKDAIALLFAMTNGKADLLFYCATLVGGRIDQGDINIIKRLNEAFTATRRIWTNSILVLTHADQCITEDDGSDSESDLPELMESFCGSFEDALKKAGVSCVNVRSGLSHARKEVKPVDQSPSYYSTILGMPAGRKPGNPPEWESALFKQVLSKCDKDAIPAMLELHGMRWKKVAYYLSKPFVKGVSDLVLGAVDEISTTFGIGKFKIIQQAMDYARVIKAREEVAKDEEKKN